jgi:protein phosphatase
MEWTLIAAALVVGLILFAMFARARKGPGLPGVSPDRNALPASSKPKRAAPEPALPNVPKLGDSAPPAKDEAFTQVKPFERPKPIPSLAGDDHEATESRAVVRFEEPALSRDEPSGPHDMIWVPAEGITDRGITRARNEDAFLVDADLGLYVIADGMGGYARGEVASRVAVKQVHDSIRAAEPVVGHADLPQRARALVAAVERANETVHAMAQSAGTGSIMGTTLLAARVSFRKRRIYVAHVGDSRCYRLRAGSLKQLTADHTHGARGVTGPSADHLFRGVGVAPKVEVDLVVDRTLEDDVYLLCSDGLTHMVGDAQIQDILSKNQSDLRRAARALVLAANAKGGRDNITVVVLGVREIATEHAGKSEHAASLH